MGRGRGASCAPSTTGATGAEGFKELFGARRGSRRGGPDEASQATAFEEAPVLSGDWDGSEAPDGGIASRFPRSLTLDEMNMMVSSLEEMHGHDERPGSEREWLEGSPDGSNDLLRYPSSDDTLIYMTREDQVDATDIGGVARILADHLRLGPEEVDVLVPEELLPDGTLLTRRAAFDPVPSAPSA
jgi:hypothetical protein